MAKKKAPGVPNRPIYSRISFLYQAATYLATTDAQNQTHADQEIPSTEEQVAVDVDMNRADDNTSDGICTQNLSRRLLSQLRATTLKSQIRISPSIKRTICKYCDTLLVEGRTCSSLVENKSKGGKKPWADTLVVKCHTCGREKRFPVSAPKQKRRPLRASAEPKASAQKRDVLLQPQAQSGS